MNLNPFNPCAPCFGIVSARLSRGRRPRLLRILGFILLLSRESRIAQNEGEKNRVNYPAALHTQLISLPARAGCEAETGFIVKNDT